MGLVNGLSHMMATYCVLGLLMLCSYGVHGDEDGQYLSVLILTSEYTAHFFPLVSLGEELVSRGHNVTMLGPVLEGQEHLKELAESRGIRFLTSGVLPNQVLQTIFKAAKHNGSMLEYCYNIWNIASGLEDIRQHNVQVQIRKYVDTMNGSDFNYIVGDVAVTGILFYIRQVWKTRRVMCNLSPIPFTPPYTIPWVFPPIGSSYTENLSFTDRFFITTFYGPLTKLLFSVVLSTIISIIDPALAVSGSFVDLGTNIPILYNSVVGFDWPRTILPLQHYVGPMLLSPPQPLDPPLLQWLDACAAHSVIYIGMGTSATVTPALANTFVELSNNYSIVWSLKESNAHVLEGLDVDDAKMYVTPWVAQFSLLQHPSLLMVLVHCGISTVQEALYNSLPVLCIPYGFDQYDTALRVSTQGVGEQLNSNNVNSEEIAKVIDKVKEGEYRTAVKRVSRLLREAGGSKKAADLVELYATIGHEHGIPAYARYNWGYIQYYNIDVWATISVIITVVIWSCVKMSTCCCRRYCCHSNKKTKTE